MKRKIWLFVVLMILTVCVIARGESGSAEGMGIARVNSAPEGDAIVLDAQADLFALTAHEDLYGAALYRAEYDMETDAFMCAETVYETWKLASGDAMYVRTYMPEIIPTLIAAGVSGDGRLYAYALAESGEDGSALLVPVTVSSLPAQAALGLIYARFGEADAATGNQYSIGLEEETAVNGAEYWNFRVSWLVADEGGGAHLSYLSNLLVSKADGSMLSALRGETGWESFPLDAENAVKDVTLYLPDADFNLMITETHPVTRDAQGILDALASFGALPKPATVNRFAISGNEAALDLSAAFGEMMASTGTAGEYLYMGCLVNTFLTEYHLTRITVTCEGNVIETGHAVYDAPLYFY